MKKIIFLIFICLFFLIKDTAFGVEDFNDIGRNLKLQKQQQKYLQLQRQEEQKNIELQKQNNFPKQNIKGFKEDSLLEKKQKPDRAVAKNQEKFKQLMDSQNKSLSQNLQDWAIKIPEEYRLIIELIAIILFISLFGFMFYRQKIRKLHEEKEAEEKQKQQSGKKSSSYYKYKYHN